jgi:hypothetical protein
MGIRISQLSANLPYTGGELIPLVQSGVTRHGSLSSITGPLVSETEFAAVSGNWQNTFTTTRSKSGNWESTFTTVCSFSAVWTSGGSPLTTVIDYLSTTNVLLSSATITDTLKTSVIITELAVNRTFSSSDNCKVFHFDTTSGALTALFPNSLPNGFNVALMNTGANVLRLSASQLYSVGEGIAVQYGAAFVYKDNNKLFAVGRL